ncbi:MAG: dienelactone hydrolase family protein, partial [Limisphaerales bacterium]
MPTPGTIHTETVDYQHNGAALEGCLAQGDSGGGKRPGVLIVHQFQGITDYEKTRARMLAEMGYVA